MLYKHTGGDYMESIIRPWEFSDAAALARAINNPRVQDNLRDGLPFPYTENDAREFISAMLGADKGCVFAFAITLNGECVGSISVTRGGNIHRRTAELGYYVAEPAGAWAWPPRPCAKSAVTCSKTATYCASTPSPSPKTPLPGAFWRKRGLRTRARYGQTP